MLINPQRAVDEGWVTGLSNPDTQIQPNAIEFTIDSMFKLRQDNHFIISEAGKCHRGVNEMHPVPDKTSSWAIYGDEDGKAEADETLFWVIENGVYDVMSNVFVQVPEGVAVMLVPRSTFTRNGLFIFSGLYDTGFSGNVGCVVHNRAGIARIGQGTRLGQMLFMTSDSVGEYAGGYNHADGTHWNE